MTPLLPVKITLTFVIKCEITQKGQIFEACRISAARISTPKRCFNMYWSFFVFITTIVNLFGAEIRVAETRQASKIWPQVFKHFALCLKSWLLKVQNTECQYSPNLKKISFYTSAYFLSTISHCKWLKISSKKGLKCPKMIQKAQNGLERP